jgi:hypothetical protein
MLANARPRGKRAPECAPMQLEFVAIGLAGMLAGAHHALTGPDHMAGVAPLVARAERRPWRIGFSWGLGHAGGALIAAGIALALRARVPGLEEQLSAVSERVVGLVLCVIGALGLRAALRREDERHEHAHSAFGLGLVHGAAGLSHLYAVLPSLALPGVALPASYLSGYAAGCLGALTVFAAVLGRLPRKHARLWLGVTSGASLATGLVWITRAM